MSEPTFNLLSGENFGSILIAFSASCILFGMCVLQAHSYYMSYPNDPTSLKVLAGIVLSLEVVHSFATIYMIYYYLITQQATVPNGPNSYPLATVNIPSIFIIILVQGFFIFRIYRFSGSRYTCIIYFLLLLRSVSASVLAVETYLDVSRVPNTVTFLAKFSWLLAFNFIMGAVTDVVIAASLCYYLKRMMPDAQPRSTSHLLNSLLLWTIRTGMITSVVSIGIVISVYVKPHDVIWFALCMLATKLYSNSFFLSLNIRNQLRDKHTPEFQFSALNFQDKTNIVEESSTEVPAEGASTTTL